MLVGLQDPSRTPLPRPDGAAARRALEQALAGDPSVEAGVDRASAQVEADFLLRLWEQITEWLEAFDRLRFESPLLYWASVALLLLVLVLLLWHIGWSVRSAVAGSRRIAARGGSDVDAPARRQRFADLLRRAHEAAGAGATREAVRLLVLALLARCDERDVLHAAGSWTLRDVTRRLEALLPADVRIRAFGRGAERAVYGIDDPNPADFAALDAELTRLVARLDDAVPGETAAPIAGAPA